MGKGKGLAVNISKRLAVLLVLMAAVIVVAGVKWFKASRTVSVDSVEARSTGPKEAKVTVIEFIDFECPACSYGYGLIKKYLDKYPGQVRVQVKYFPLIRAHRHAMQTALYHECAARQDKFWPFLDQVMPAQKQWSSLLSIDVTFDDMAKQAGVNGDVLKECLASQSAKDAIDDDVLLGKSLGVQSTPTYFINNVMVVGTKSLLEQMSQYFPGGV